MVAHRLSSIFIVLLGAATLLTLTSATKESEDAASRKMYARAHSLGDTYTFDPRDGWETANTTDLTHQYRNTHHKRASHGALWQSISRRSKHKSKSHNQHDPSKQRLHSSQHQPARQQGEHGALDAAGKIVQGIWDGLKGVGKKQDGIITWYTGHDLLNPSCWADSRWAPTDASFVCALTLEGWVGRPNCFSFLEICNVDNKKCVFVRVVDTCAGCKPGSKHMDLTLAAFKALASPDKGMMTVKWRLAHPPEKWNTDMWGPK